MFHPELRSPVVFAKSAEENRNHMWPAAWAVPWLCWGSVISGGGRPKKLAMLARHWGILRPLGLPSPPICLPMPPILTKASIGPCSAEDDEVDEDESD